ncbi:pantoate kinase [Methanohalophilus levihalophilus]|uniref:pantoate kinase n=1 Tax=Methanohalophilus levihalophilus TaxID=1431282 RepID=UPI001AE99646|nr:pantoate kinase [Methanohalophilus levihalophilus]MBP2030466.1 pantoate kinase [Methanohalophilus levihalophilus]
MKSKVTTATAFAPGHITGFFVIHEDDNPCLKGTIGCGLVLDKGLTSTVTSLPEAEDSEVFLNGSLVNAPVTSHLVKSLIDAPVRVSSNSEIPIGSGFGASAAGALSTGYGLNELFSLGLSQNDIVEKVHVAEVLEGGGLGDVEAQAYGGAVIRKAPGPLTTTGKLDRIPCSSFEVHYVVLGNISTKAVLSNPATVKCINKAGNKAMKKLMDYPDIERFMEASYDFSLEIDLLSTKAKDAIEAVQSVGGLASQAMLGDSVFAISDEHCRDAVLDSLSEFGAVSSSKVSGTH